MDLYIFVKGPMKRAIRIHLMIGNPKFGNYFSKNLEDHGFLWDTVLFDVFWNEQYWEREYSSGVERNHRIWTIPSLRRILNSKRMHKEIAIRSYNRTPLGALFG